MEGRNVSVTCLVVLFFLLSGLASLADDDDGAVPPFPIAPKALSVPQTSAMVTVTLEHPQISDGSSFAPIVPSEHWIKVTSSHSHSEGETPTRVHVRIGTNFNIVDVWCQISAQNNLMSTDPSLIIWPDTGACEVTLFGDNSLRSILRFQLNGSWQDADQINISSYLHVDDGTPSGADSTPRTTVIGSGSTVQGYEGDVVLLPQSSGSSMMPWLVERDDGSLVQLSQAYLRTGESVKTLVSIGFENDTFIRSPRNHSVKVSVLIDGEEVANTTEITTGLAVVEWVVPPRLGLIQAQVLLEPLSGGSMHEPDSGRLALIVDGSRPTLIGCDIPAAGHLARDTRSVRCEVADLPILPESLSLNLWQEWKDDLDENSEPDAGEWSEISMGLAVVENSTVGNYTADWSDLGGDLGELVFGYVSGSDIAGNQVRNGGSSDFGDHVFSYKIGGDLDPEVEADAGVWSVVSSGTPVTLTDPWMHPDRRYIFEIELKDENGFVDLRNLTLGLDDDVGTSDIEWDQEGGCQVNRVTITLHNCTLSAPTGGLSVYATDMIFSLEMSFSPSFLSDRSGSSIYPFISVRDASGRVTYQELDAAAWRGSAEVFIDSNTLVVEQIGGLIEGDEIWMRSGRTITAHGSVHWLGSELPPVEPLQVRGTLGNVETIVQTSDGAFMLNLTAPSMDAMLPLQFDLVNLSDGVDDLTVVEQMRSWVTVDGTSPIPTEIVSPRSSAILVPEDLEEGLNIAFEIAEEGRMDPQLINLRYRIFTMRDDSVGALVEEGVIQLASTTSARVGGNLPLVGLLNLEKDLPPDFRKDPARLEIYFEGKDVAGNPAVSNEAGRGPMVSWIIQHDVPDIGVPLGGLDLSRTGVISVLDPVTIVLNFKNAGLAAGQGNFRVVASPQEGDPIDIEGLYLVLKPGESIQKQVSWSPSAVGTWSIQIIDDQDEIIAQSMPIFAEDSSSVREISALSEVHPAYSIVIVIQWVLLAVILIAIGYVRMPKGPSWSEEEEDDDEYEYT